MASLVPPEFAPSDFCCDYSSPLSSDYLTDYLENGTQVLDELLHVQGFPTPPTSPERVYSPAEEEDSESDSSQDFPMLNELILLAYGEEVIADSPIFSCDRNLQDKLIQDCMWSGHLCEKDIPKTTVPAPLNLAPMASPDSGVYSPASSPTPPPVPTECDTSAGEEIAPMQADCISPSAVFPTLLPPTSSAAATNSNGGANMAEVKKSLRMAERFHKGVEPVRRRLERERYERRFVTMAMTGGNGRVQPQAESSTSDEEIDVVTIPAMERTKMSRKRTLPLSPPCSRQSSPHPVSSPPKRKKYHTKRLSSAGSCGDGIESDDEARRASHNVLERKRRNDLKSSFQKLREEIPELEDNQRAPKVTILRKAMDYIQHMQELERAAERELQMERRRKAKLLERLSQLRSCHV